MTKNLTGLALDLMTVYDQLKDGTIEPDKAKDLAKIANAVVNTSRVVLDFNTWRNPKGSPETAKQDIPLLN